VNLDSSKTDEPMLTAAAHVLPIVTNSTHEQVKGHDQTLDRESVKFEQSGEFDTSNVRFQTRC
jgi:hypothetical protein